ncbi:MAG: hypothetical protein AB7F19_07285 [Candidatus Babeliales bacterium]
MQEIVLICTPLRFYSQNDEDLMFGWLDKIKSVTSYKGIGRELHVYIKSKNIPKLDLLELMGIFDRYKFDAKQLEIFKNESNQKWFEEN